MKFSKIGYLINFIIIFITTALALMNYISSTQQMILIFASLGTYLAFYDTNKLAKESIIKNNQKRITATLVIIVIFLSSSIFLYYPTFEGALTLALIAIVIAFGFQITEWYEKAKLYDQIKGLVKVSYFLLF